MNKVTVKVLLFAKAKELYGKKEGTITVDSAICYTDLLQGIVQEYSLSDIGGNIILAVNEEYLDQDEVVRLNSGDTIAVIPPLSGGDVSNFNTMDILKLEECRLNINEISQSVKSPKCGAISLFIGTTRDNFDGLKVTKLSYEAYDAMALKSMKRVCTDIRKKWSDIENIAIYHRLGDVPVTEESVVIAVSSPHRHDSLEAVHYAIDALKASVPVWKKEEYQDKHQEPAWKENKECSWSNASSS